MIGLALYPDGEIRELDVDLARRDVLLAALDSTDVEEVRVGDRLVLFIDPWSTRDVAPVNVYASMLLLGAGQVDPFHGLHGPVIVFGLSLDSEPVDVPARLVGFLESVSEGLP